MPYDSLKLNQRVLHCLSIHCGAEMIKGYTEAKLAELLSEHFSPSKEITDPDRLIGRERSLTQIRRALLSPGRHVFIHGERGVGKTSLSITAGLLASLDEKNFIYVPCGNDTTFFEVITAIVSSIHKPSELAAGKGPSFNLGGNVFGLGGGNLGYSSGDRARPSSPSTMNDAYEALRYVREKLQGTIVVVVDELDRIKSTEERRKFAEFIKNISTKVDDLRFILCGIGANVDEIIGEHLSTGRMFEPVEVERLSHDKLWKIIEDVADALAVDVPRGFLIRTSKISDGFPHYVHLIGECLFYAIFDDPREVREASREHFSAALKSALAKTEPSIKKIYDMATAKSKNMIDYEEALWALAHRTADKRQVREIFEASYLRIQRDHSKIRRDERTPLNRTKLNDRLLTLRGERHANIVVGHGSGWFSFRENVVRGYARLKAETEGVELVQELVD